MLDDPVFIGPIGAGKTTIATLVATVLGKPLCSMDEVRFTYYAEIGYDAQRASQIRKERGLRSLYEYWKPFEAHAVERVLSEKSGCVFDFGAGHASYDDPTLFRRVKRALAPYRHVVLLLPSADPGESIRILQKRRPDLEAEVVELNGYLVRHPAYSALATHTVYTKERKPEEVRDEVLALIRGSRARPTAPYPGRMDAALGRRIIVIGDSGSGKSSIAAELAQRLGTKIVELDALYWETGWVEAGLDVFQDRVRTAVEADEWVLAGNYRAQQSHISWPRAQTIVWLDLPLRITIPRLLARSFLRWRSGERIWGDNRERFWSQFKIWDPEASLVGWNLKTHRARQRDFGAAMRDPDYGGIHFVRLRSPGEVERWLNQPRRR